MAKLNRMGVKYSTMEIKPSLSLGVVTDLPISSPETTFHLSVTRSCALS